MCLCICLLGISYIILCFPFDFQIVLNTEFLFFFVRERLFSFKKGGGMYYFCKQYPNPLFDAKQIILNPDFQYPTVLDTEKIFDDSVGKINNPPFKTKLNSCSLNTKPF